MAAEKKTGKKQDAPVRTPKKAAGAKTGKKQDALVTELKKQVKKLANQVKALEKERDALDKQLAKQRAKAKDAIAAAEKNAKKAIAKARATYSSQSSKAVTFIEDHSPIDVPDVIEKALGADAPAASAGPDGSWTVTRLRAEARAQKVPGYSRMTKPQLLSALS